MLAFQFCYCERRVFSALLMGSYIGYGHATGEDTTAEVLENFGRIVEISHNRCIQCKKSIYSTWVVLQDLYNESQLIHIDALQRPLPISPD